MALPESVRQDVNQGRTGHRTEQITLRSMTGESRTVVMERFQSEGGEPGDLSTDGDRGHLVV